MAFALLVLLVILAACLLLLSHSLRTREPEVLSRFGEEDEGSYVLVSLDHILDFYCEEYGADGKTTAWYAVVPGNGGLMTYILPPANFDTAEAVLYDTYAWLNGGPEDTGGYLFLEGTVERLSMEAEEKLYGWFSETNGWLREAGVIGESTDYADHLSPYAVRIGYIEGAPKSVTYIMDVLAIALLLCGIFIVVKFRIGYPKASPETIEKEPQEDKEN